MSKIIGHIIHESYVQPEQLMIIDQTSEYVVFKAILQDFFDNRNKRRYTKEWLVDCLNAPHIRELKLMRNWFGEAGHPLDKSLERQTVIDHERVSHMILETYITDTSIEADIMTTPTAFGYDLMKMITIVKMIPAFSMRGMGKIAERGGIAYVEKPGRVITYDQVYYPSHKRAYGKGVGNVSLIDKHAGYLKESTLAYANAGYEETETGLLIPITLSMAKSALNESDNFNSLLYSDYLSEEAEIIFDKTNGNIIIAEKNNYTIKLDVEASYKSKSSYRELIKSL